MVLSFILISRKGMCMENIVGQPQTVQVPNYSGVNIQIFNPTVATPGASAPASTVNATNYSTNPCYPSNYYTQNLAQPAQQETAQPVQSVLPVQYVQIPPAESKKTEKREIVELTDEYIKNVETYLNSQDKELRLIGAKEVLDRLEEDKTRRNDEALTALVNKMLQDPYQPIKFMAMAMVEERNVAGNEETKELLRGIQQKKTADGQDSLKASNVLLKMSATTTEKEFEVNNSTKDKNGKK